jgi:hypothetical protein
MIYNCIKEKLKCNPTDNPTTTLITKIMLGVFGLIPAYDNYFKKTFRDISKSQGYSFKFSSFNSVESLKKSLDIIYDFYIENKKVIDELSSKTFTKDFLSEENTALNYKKAKIIDMYGFYTAYKKQDRNTMF